MLAKLISTGRFEWEGKEIKLCKLKLKINLKHRWFSEKYIYDEWMHECVESGEKPSDMLATCESKLHC